MLIVKLTQEQIDAIAPAKARIAEMADDGRPGMLLAQVYGDHMRVGVMNHEDALAVQKAVGRGVGMLHRTAYELVPQANNGPATEITE